MATAILSRPTKPAVKPVTPPQQRPIQERLRHKLDMSHLGMDRLDQMIHVAVTALYSQDCNVDSGVAICLEAAVSAELEPARESIVEALALLQEVADG